MTSWSLKVGVSILPSWCFMIFFLFTSLGLFHHQSRAHPNRFGSNAGEILAWSPSRFVAQYWWWNQRNFHAFEPNLFWWIFFRLVRLSQEVGLGPRLSTKDSGHQRPSFGQGWRVGQKSPATWARLSASGIFTWVAKGKCLGWRNIFECVMALLIVSVSWFFFYKSSFKFAMHLQVKPMLMLARNHQLPDLRVGSEVGHPIRC